MPKGLLPEKLALLAETNYIKQGVNIVITGATGVGKSALSIAAAIEAIRKGYTVRYFRMMELISILNAKVDDSFIRFRELLHRTDVLLIDMISLLNSMRLLMLAITREQPLLPLSCE